MTQGTVTLEQVGRFTDQQLIARLRGLVRADQALGARLLVHLGEVDARGLYREHAYPSMFAYCVEELHMSEAEAYLRIQAARLGRQFPLVVELFERGSLHLSAIKLLGAHLTPDNHVRVLERASGKRKREIEELVAELAPKPDVASRMRKLPERSSTQASRGRAPLAPLLAVQPGAFVVDASIAAPPVVESRVNQAPCALKGFITAPTVGAREASFVLEAPRRLASLDLAAQPASSVSDASIAAPLVLEKQANQAPCGLERAIVAPVSAREASFVLEAPRRRPRGSCVPLSPGRYKVEFTAGRELRDKLEQLGDLLRHRVPDGDLAVIVELAVELLFDKTMKQRFAQTQAPKQQRSIRRGDDAQTQAPKQRSIQRGDERARATVQVHPLAVRATGSPAGWLRQVNSRYIPRAVVREVYERDDGRCTFVSSDGKRCSGRGFLELHHHDLPYGKGGKATVDNLRLACRAHNALFAERDYGARFMRLKRRRGGHERANQIHKFRDEFPV